MIKIAVCDDDIYMTSTIDEMLAEIGKECHIQISCETFFDGKALLENLCKGNIYDLIYMDIEMEHMDGISTGARIREMGIPALIIFVSGHEQFLKKLFDVEPFRFLSKPINKEEFREVFQAAHRRICLKPAYFSYVNNKSLKKIPLNSISYFESSGRVVYIYEAGARLKDEEGRKQKPTEKFYGKINDVEEQIRSTHSRFLRIHQSYLVNFDYIKSMSFTAVHMLDDTVLQISKERQKNIRRQFCSLAGMEVIDNVGYNRI